MKTLSGLLVIILFLGALSCKNLENEIKEGDTLAGDDLEEYNFEDEDFLAEDSLEGTDVVIVDNSSSEDDDSKPTESQENTSPRPRKFYIIGGSFKEFQNAKKQYSLFAKKGFSDSQIMDPTNSGFRRVVIAAYDDEAIARKALKKFRSERNDPDIWLLRVYEN